MTLKKKRRYIHKFLCFVPETLELLIILSWVQCWQPHSMHSARSFLELYQTNVTAAQNNFFVFEILVCLTQVQKVWVQEAICFNYTCATDISLVWCGLEEAQIHTYCPIGVGERICFKISLIYWFATVNFQERP